MLFTSQRGEEIKINKIYLFYLKFIYFIYLFYLNFIYLFYFIYLFIYLFKDKIRL